jgi:phage tail protein X
VRRGRCISRYLGENEAVIRALVEASEGVAAASAVAALREGLHILYYYNILYIYGS